MEMPNLDSVTKSKCGRPGGASRWLELIRKKLLGEILRRKGLITDDQLAWALKKQRQLIEEQRRVERLAGPALAGPVSFLGQILVRMGAVNELRVAEALREQERMDAEPLGVGIGRLGLALESGAAVGAAAASAGLSEALRRILKGAGRVAGGLASVLLLLDEPGDRIVFCVACGPVARRLVDPRALGRSGVAARVLQSGEPVLVAKACGDPSLTPEIETLGGFSVQTILAVPLKDRGRLIGVLEVLNRASGGPFTAKDELALSIFACQCALAVDQARRAQPIRAGARRP